MLVHEPAVVIVSGGMDSVTLAHWVQANITHEVHGLSFDYGQRHKKELGYATRLVNTRILTTHQVVDLSNVNALVSASSLTNPDIDIPDGHYAEETMKATVVPNRNMVMLSLAIGYAVTIKASAGVWFGVHGGDHFIYPDCRPDFIRYLNNAAYFGNEGFVNWVADVVTAPFSSIDKARIAEIGKELGVDYSQTWSCYKGGDVHCGRCGTCVERKEAFRLSRVLDPTEYADPEFEIAAYRG